MRQLYIYLAALLLAFTVASGAQATTVTLQSLFSGGSIIAGDKQFADFYVIDQTSVGDGSTPDYGLITVTALNDGGMNPGPGLLFATNGQLTATGDTFGYSSSELFFGFSVTVMDPSKLIEDASLSFSNSTISGSGDNGVTVVEQVGTTQASVANNLYPAADLATINTEFSWLDATLGGGGQTSNPSGSANFAPLSKIYVSKDLYVWSGSPSETAIMGDITQRFSQVPVPEPNMVLLMTVGLMGFAFSAKRRKSLHGE